MQKDQQARVAGLPGGTDSLEARLHLKPCRVTWQWHPRACSGTQRDNDDHDDDADGNEDLTAQGLDGQRNQLLWTMPVAALHMQSLRQWLDRAQTTVQSKKDVQQLEVHEYYAFVALSQVTGANYLAKKFDEHMKANKPIEQFNLWSMHHITAKRRQDRWKWVGLWDYLSVRTSYASL